MNHLRATLCAAFVAFSLASAPAFADDSGETTDVSFTTDFTVQTTQTCGALLRGQPCVITVDASSSNCRVRFVEIVGVTTVSFSRHGRRDTGTKSHVWRGDSCRVSLPWAISDNVLGGDVRLSLNYRMTNGQAGSDGKALTVVGAALDPATVRADIRNPTYEAAVYHLSRFQHFASDGWPLVAQGFGVGALGAPDAGLMWNWKANLAARVALLDTAFAQAAAHPASMRAAGFVDLPDFTPDQIKLQALQSLVGQDYFLPAPTGGGWQAVPTRLSFADDIARTEADVAAGNPPSGW